MFFNDILFNEKVNNTNDLFDASDGFMYGNMFKNEYEGYKNYNVPNLVGSNDYGRLLLEIYEYDFALNDLSLYLDLHPNDDQIYKLFRIYTEKENKLVSEFEQKYGPLNLSDSDYDSYLWYKGKWPFEGVDL